MQYIPRGGEEEGRSRMEQGAHLEPCPSFRLSVLTLAAAINTKTKQRSGSSEMWGEENSNLESQATRIMGQLIWIL